MVSDVDAQSWDDVADVVVVGYGGAGVCAALEARAHGADVLAVDRFAGGGATALCGGIYYGGATRFQREAGYEDTAEQMYRYLKQEVGDSIRDETLRRFCEQSNANLEWLMSHGIQFGSATYKGKRSYPPAGYDLYFSGNEKVARYSQHAAPAPRGHRVVGPKYTGHVLYGTLRKSADAKGVRVRGHTKVTRLIMDASHRVVGVEAMMMEPGTAAWKQHRKLIDKVNTWQRFFSAAALRTAKRVEALESEHGKLVRIRARRGVVLSTGSFVFNRPMVEAYAPLYREAMPLGTLGCNGSGIQLGQSAGAAVDCMDKVTAWRSISPPIEFVKGIVVNKEGRRFINEDTYLGHLGNAVAEQTEGRAWVIVDREGYKRSFKDTKPVRGEPWHEFALPLLINLLSAPKGKDLRTLADRCGIDAAGLEATKREYNTAVAAKRDPKEKSPDYLQPLGEGPYYAIDVSIGCTRFPCPTITMGGLAVDEDSGHVTRSDGSHIEGLFAAGRAAKGVPSGFYVSGTSVADCVFSGRRAGLSVMS